MNKASDLFGTNKPTLTTINGVNAVLFKIKLKENVVESVTGFRRFGVREDFKLLIESLAGEFVEVALFGINPTPVLSGRTNTKQLTECTNRVRETADWVAYTPHFENTVQKIIERFGEGDLGFNLTYSMIEPTIEDIKEYLLSHGIEAGEKIQPLYDFGDKVSIGGVEGRVQGFWRKLSEKEKADSLIFDAQSSVEPIYPCTPREADVLCVDGNFFKASEVSLVFKDENFDNGYLKDNHAIKLTIVERGCPNNEFARVSVPKTFFA